MSLTNEELCQLMHDTYETAAVKHGWHTNERSRVTWSQVPEENKATMRDAVATVVGAVKEEERVKHDTETIQSDLRSIMRALGISVHARNSSPHEVIQNEILPKIRKVAEYDPESQADLILIMSALNINSHARTQSPHEIVQNEILPALRKIGQSDLRLIMDELELITQATSSREMIKNEIVPAIRSLKERLGAQEKLALTMKRTLINIKIALGKNYDEVKERLVELGL